ncbi:MAG: hypothetical protein AAGK71_05205 [Pseudomonadota bacterium]
MIQSLGFIGRHGRWSLVAGLIAGFALPGVAVALRDWLPHFIAALLFISAYRIGPRAVFGSLTDLRHTALHILVLQLGAPLFAIGALTIAGMLHLMPALAFVLVLAAPSVTGAPNFAILMGKDPGRAMQLLLVGTALFPLTVIPVLWAIPAISTVSEVLLSAARLLGVIVLAVGAAFLLRRDRSLSDGNRDALDGIAAVLLAVLVIGLMSAMGPALRETPCELFLWLAFALVLNFGLQLNAYAFMAKKNAGVAIVTGNRNIALFLVALPPDIVDELLLFIGCYQIPMYLTPLVMRRVMRSGA